MRKIKKPMYCVQNVIEKLYSEEPDSFIDITVTNPYFKIKDFLRTAKREEENYKNNMNDLRELAECENFYCFSKNDMKNLYGEFTKSLSEFRTELYSVSERCPICDSNYGYSRITLDHLLPKSKYPQYAITPINLVPVCLDCNMNKGAAVGLEATILSPYYHEYNIRDFVDVEISNITSQISNLCVHIRFKDFHEVANLGYDESNYLSVKANFKLFKLEKKFTLLSGVLFKNQLKIYTNKEIFSNVHSLNSLRVLIESDDSWIKKFENQEVSHKELTYANEEFFKHLNIRALLDNEKALKLIFEKLNDGLYCTTGLNRALNFLESFPRDNTALFIPSNFTALINKAFSNLLFVGLYYNVSEHRIFQAIDFQGEYQESVSTPNLNFNNPDSFFHSAICNNEVKERNYFDNDHPLISSRKKIGSEILIPIENSQGICVKCVYLASENSYYFDGIDKLRLKSSIQILLSLLDNNS